MTESKKISPLRFERSPGFVLLSLPDSFPNPLFRFFDEEAHLANFIKNPWFASRTRNRYFQTDKDRLDDMEGKDQYSYTDINGITIHQSHETLGVHGTLSFLKQKTDYGKNKPYLKLTNPEGYLNAISDNIFNDEHALTYFESEILKNSEKLRKFLPEIDANIESYYGKPVTILLSAIRFRVLDYMNLNNQSSAERIAVSTQEQIERAMAKDKRFINQEEVVIELIGCLPFR